MTATLMTCALAGLSPRATGGIVDQIPWPASGSGSGPFTGSTMATLSGDLRMDVVVVSAGELVCFDCAGLQASGGGIATTGDVNDVATLPIDGQAVPGDRDLLVVAASDGLWTMKETATGPLFTAIDTSAAWQGAQRVVVADLDNDGDDDIVVLRADGRTVDAKIQRPAGNFIDTGNYSWTAASDVLDFAVGEFNSQAAQPELVVNDETGLRILSAAGATLVAYASARPDLDAMALVKRDETSQVNDRVAWFTAASAVAGDPVRHFAVIDLASATLCFTTSDPFGRMAAGRFDDDAATDLVVTRDGESELWLFPQQLSGGTPFQYAEHDLYEIGGSTEVAAVRPCIGDLGNDRYDDFALPVASLGVLAVANETAVPLALTVVNDFTHDETCAEIINGNVHHVSVIARLGSAGALAGDPTWFVEYVVYRFNYLAGTYTTTPVTYCRKLIADVLVPEPNEPDDVEIEFYANPTSAMYVVQTRLVQVISGAVVDSSPTIFGAYDKEELNIQELLSDGENHASWTSYQAVPKCGTTTRIGGFIRIRRMPPSAPPTTPPQAPYGPPQPGQCQ
ncbi:MAG: hypothetical protein JNL90_06480 [Planctomycetes bacterium]|nr:hypothetical protein [Planctomycetota bacterium]